MITDEQFQELVSEIRMTNTWLRMISGDISTLLEKLEQAEMATQEKAREPNYKVERF